MLRMMFTFVLLAQLVALSRAVTLPHLLRRDPVYSSGCPTDGPISCQVTSAPSNTCCTEYPMGLIQQTQFWDTNVAGSPATSWTIHGLWNNNCDGTYEEDCDPSRDYDVQTLLENQGATDTLDFMNQYWLNDDGTNQELWNHEWVTHGTCYSTLETDCVSEYPQGAEAVAYCETIVKLFQTLPTYTWLADAGITPTTSDTFTLTEIISALQEGSGGYAPTVSCSGSSLSEINWWFNLQGSAIDGVFIPITAPSSQSNSCPSSGIQYVPKSG